MSFFDEEYIIQQQKVCKKEWIDRLEKQVNDEIDKRNKENGKKQPHITRDFLETEYGESFDIGFSVGVEWVLKNYLKELQRIRKTVIRQNDTKHN